MIYSPETNAILTLTLATLHLIKLLQKAFLKMLTLCTLALLRHVKGTWYFYCDWYGFGVAQYLVSETRVAVSIFEESNITQYIFLPLV